MIESAQMDSQPSNRKEKQKQRFKARRRELRKAAADLVRQRKEAKGRVDEPLQQAPPQSPPPPSLPAPSAQSMSVPQGNLQSGQTRQQQKPPVGRGGRGGGRGVPKGPRQQPQPRKQPVKGQPKAQRGKGTRIPLILADPRWNPPSTPAAVSQTSPVPATSLPSAPMVTSPFAMPDPIRSPSKTVIPAEARRQGIVSVQEYMHQDTRLPMPPAVATGELVAAKAPIMQPPQKYMYSAGGLKGASFVEELSKNIVKTPFVPSIVDATTPEDSTELLTPSGICEAFAAVERRRQDLGAASPYPDIMPLEVRHQSGDSDLTWAMTQDRQMSPQQLYYYKIKELETFIQHDTIALSREKDVIAKAKLVLTLEVMKKKLHELRELCGSGGSSNKSESPLLPDGNTTKEFDEDLAKRADATGRFAPPASPMEETVVEDEADSYKDSEEEEKVSESTSSFQGVTQAEDEAFENAFLDAAAWTPLPDDGPV